VRRIQLQYERDNTVNQPVEPKDVIGPVFGAATSLAGLLLVFVGFVYARGESYNTKRGDRFKLIAKLGIVPFLVSLLCAWLCLQSLSGAAWAYDTAILSFRITILLTAGYGICTMLFFL